MGLKHPDKLHEEVLRKLANWAAYLRTEMADLPDDDDRRFFKIVACMVESSLDCFETLVSLRQVCPIGSALPASLGCFPICFLEDRPCVDASVV